MAGQCGVGRCVMCGTAGRRWVVGIAGRCVWSVCWCVGRWAFGRPVWAVGVVGVGVGRLVGWVGVLGGGDVAGVGLVDGVEG